MKIELQEVTIRDLAETVRDVVGYRGAITWDRSKPDGTPRKLLDSSRILALGWTPRISLRDGLASTYQWALRHDAFAEARVRVTS